MFLDIFLCEYSVDIVVNESDIYLQFFDFL
jgi:hypothetical protein